jgi:predicted dehydrogenase
VARALRVVVIGPGRAGRARIRALRGHPRAELAAEVARSGEPTLAGVAADRSIDAALICTPNLLHPPQARALLEAGKHVAVEFPLAPTAEDARALFALAERNDRVLHVAHIELLSASQQGQRERAPELGRPTGGALRFSGGGDGWIGDPERAGSPALRALARLHRLLDLFGPARVTVASLALRAGGYRLELGLTFRDGGETTLVEERGPGLERRTRWAVRCERGVLGDPDAVPASGLFERDLDHFLDRIEHAAPPYVANERVLHALDLVEQAERLCAGAGSARPGPARTP